MFKHLVPLTLDPLQHYGSPSTAISGVDQGFSVLSPLLKRAGALLSPKLAARQVAHRRFGKVGQDSGNFTHPDQLLSLLSPYRLVSFDLFDTLVWREVALRDVHRKTAEFGERVIRGDNGPLPAGLLLNLRGRHQEAGPVTELFRSFDLVFCHKGETSWHRNQPRNSARRQCG